MYPVRGRRKPGRGGARRRGGTVAAVPPHVVGPPAEGVVETEIDDCVALFHPGTAEATVLNPTASDIWRLSDGSLTLPQLTGALARAYGVEPASIAGEVAEAVARLRQRGLLVDDGA